MTDVFDFDELLTRACGDQDLALEVLSDFLRGALEHERVLKDESPEVTRQTKARDAHRLRGALLAIGAARAAGIAGEYELAALSEDAEAVKMSEPLRHRTLAELAIVKSAIEELLANPPTSPVDDDEDSYLQLPMTDKTVTARG